MLRSTGSRRAGSVIVAHGPSHSEACGIFPDQGSNPYPLHWQADSQPLRHQGSPWRPHLSRNIDHLLVISHHVYNKVRHPSQVHLAPMLWPLPTSKPQSLLLFSSPAPSFRHTGLPAALQTHYPLSLPRSSSPDVPMAPHPDPCSNVNPSKRPSLSSLC